MLKEIVKTNLEETYDRLTSDNMESSRNKNTPLKDLANLGRLFIDTHTCILTFVDLQQNQVQRIASSSQNQEFEEYLDNKRTISLDSTDTGTGVSFEIASKGEEYETDKLQEDGGGISNPEISKKFGLTYFYCYPIKIKGLLKGYINFFSDTNSHFSNSLKTQIRIISRFAEIPIQQYEMERIHNKTLKDAIEETALNISENDHDQILISTLKHAIKLLGKDEIFSSVLKHDERSGMLVELNAIPAAKKDLSNIPFGNGYCSQALLEEKELIIDINSPDWDKKYIDAWGMETKNEMVIPILIKNEQVRNKRNFACVSRPIGVLNFESQNLNEFSPEDIDVLLPLISQVSLLIEKMIMERKVSQLRIIEKQLSTKQTRHENLRIIAEGIIDVLGFEVVNISLVDILEKNISTEVIIGIEPQKVKKFIQMATHSLSSKDIQSSIVKNKKTEVPDENDIRFDTEIWNEFGHKDLIRVFVPVISSITNKCVGTIEAGYKKGYRKHIYESDIQMLQSFAELIEEAIEKQNSQIMDKISHELRSPVSGILGNIDRLKTHHRDWGYGFIDVKLDDIELDCEILKHNILELEFFLGRPFPKVKIGDKPVAVMKEIVLKSLKQLKPLIEEEGFYFDLDSCINRRDLDKVKIYTDKIKLGQVFYNLLANSIRYANKNSRSFDLKVIADDETDDEFFIIRFQDWGIGIKEEHEDKIFNDYFRAPEAKAQFVSGSGLGLTISRTIMRNDIKGDLILANISEPTEFNVKIPKRYIKKPLS